MITICVFPHQGKEYCLIDDATYHVRAWDTPYLAMSEWNNSYTKWETFAQKMLAYIFMLKFPVRFVEIDENQLTQYVVDTSVYLYSTFAGHMRGFEIDFSRQNLEANQEVQRV